MRDKILLIEDIATFRAILSASLRRQGYQVISCETGATGLRAAFTLAPHLICLDLSLPDVSGVDVLSCLKANPNTQPIPVIICTACVDGSLGDELQRRGAAEILIKPIQPAELFRVLGRHLRRTSKDPTISAASLR
jgi:two-component system, sensor histidine kinase and response regulator